MAYIRRSGAETLGPDTVLRMAAAVGLAVPDEDLGPLATALTDQLAAVATLHRLDLTHFDPALEFDPRWHELSDRHERSHRTHHS